MQLYNLKNVTNTHGVVLLLVKLRAKACNFIKVTLLHGCSLANKVAKSDTPPWVFFTCFKMYKCYQIAQGIIIDGKYSFQKEVYIRAFCNQHLIYQELAACNILYHSLNNITKA